MKSKIFYSLIATTILFLSGCFKDSGNYTYTEINPPKWLFNIQANNINVYGRGGALTSFQASDKFTWGADSLERREEVRFEWKIGDIVIGNELDFKIPTDELMQKIGMDDFPESFMGSFHVIEKANNIRHMVRVYITLTPRYAMWDLLAISEDGENTKLTAVLSKKKDINGVSTKYYEIEENSFNEINNMQIPGKPVNLHLAKARNIGSLGSATIITDQVSYEINAGSLVFYKEMKDNFPDGTPSNFVVSDRDDIDGEEGSYTFIATKEGKVYTRNMSANYLGGNFLSEPYYLDSKGYNITKFGHHTMGYPNIPCYDEKNNRVVMANRWRVDIQEGDNTIMVYKCRLIAPQPRSADNDGVPVWNMPEGTKVLYITQARHFKRSISPTSTLYTIYYQDAVGKTFMADFVMSNKDVEISKNSYANKRWKELPDNFDGNTLFLTSASHAYYGEAALLRTFYSKGNDLRYIQRSKTASDGSFTDNKFLSFDSKITFITYNWYNCTSIIIGCENGDIYIYDINNIQNPKLISKVNTGGKIVSIRQLGDGGNDYDYF